MTWLKRDTAPLEPVEVLRHKCHPPRVLVPRPHGVWEKLRYYRPNGHKGDVWICDGCLTVWKIISEDIYNEVEDWPSQNQGWEKALPFSQWYHLRMYLRRTNPK